MSFWRMPESRSDQISLDSGLGIGILDNCSCIVLLSPIHGLVRRSNSSIHGVARRNDNKEINQSFPNSD